AEVILLTIAAPEPLGVERSNLIETIAADVHAEADRGGNVDGDSRIHPSSLAIELWVVDVQEHVVVLDEVGIAADGGVVRERRHRADRAIGMRSSAETVEPVGVDDGIGVEKQDVAPAVQRHTAVYARNESEVSIVPDQCN